MPFTAISNAIATCDAVLNGVDEADPAKPELESYLVAGVVVLIVSEYEELIERLFRDRAAKCGDVHVCGYVKAMMAEKFRSPDLGKITEILGKFGADYRKSFSDAVLDTPAHAAWDNIMKERHAAVHKKGPRSLTIREVAIYMPRTEAVIDALKATLGVA